MGWLVRINIWSNAVLRITTIQEDESNIKVRLYGHFTEEYIAEVERTLANGDTMLTVALDLANVTFVDRKGMIFLCTALCRKISIENIPSYVQRWIQQELSCRRTEGKPQDCGSHRE